MPRPVSSKPENSSTDKDAPLKEDIRLLGRLLGEVLREQEGDAGGIILAAVIAVGGVHGLVQHAVRVL